MEKIYIGFSYHKDNLLSKIIQYLEGSSYSHVYIRRQSKYGEYVYQASGLAVNFTNIDIFLEDNIIVEEYEFELPEEEKGNLLSFFIKYAGAKYQLSSLFKLLYLILLNRFNCNYRFNGDGDKKFICSELGAFFSKYILHIDIKGTLDFITPKQLNPIIQKYGKRVK